MYLLIFVARKPEYMSDEEWEFEHQQGSVLNKEMRRKAQGSPSQFEMSNDDVTKVIGVGDVCLQTNTGI
ncbi:hypothetical protein CR513_41045, partial [Mucuna pruriens]